ncbi:MAG: hypothetical protein HZC38_14215 [Chloroflexi bacterium]|nr:hypothetical protein [Chloroflexota bacterium]
MKRFKSTMWSLKTTLCAKSIWVAIRVTNVNDLLRELFTHLANKIGECGEIVWRKNW